MQRSDDRDPRSPESDRTDDRRSTGAVPARATPPSARPVRHAWRSLVLGWTDPESGDELTLDVRGGAEFARGLEGMGFEILAQPDAGADAPTRSGTIEVVAQRRPTGAKRRGGDHMDMLARSISRGRRTPPK